MCVWHAGVAGRGGNEIASYLLNAITSGMITKKNCRFVAITALVKIKIG